MRRFTLAVALVLSSLGALLAVGSPAEAGVAPPPQRCATGAYTDGFESFANRGGDNNFLGTQSADVFPTGMTNYMNRDGQAQYPNDGYVLGRGETHYTNYGTFSNGIMYNWYGNIASHSFGNSAFGYWQWSSDYC